MRVALSEMVVDGIKTNIPLQQRIMRRQRLPAGRAEHPLPGEAAGGAEGQDHRVGVSEALADERKRRRSYLDGGCWVPSSGRAPMLETGLPTTMVSDEPSGHTILKVLPGGSDEKGTPLVAR